MSQYIDILCCFVHYMQYNTILLTILPMIYHCVVLNIAQFCALYCTLSAGFATMAGLKNACDGFAYTIDSKEGGYVLNITNAAAIMCNSHSRRDDWGLCCRCS